MPLIYDRVGQPYQGTFYHLYITLNCPVSNLLDIKMLGMTTVTSLHFISSEKIIGVPAIIVIHRESVGGP